MIKLEVENYCQSCPEFEPDVDRNTQRYFAEDFNPFAYEPRVYTVCDTIVRCEHRVRCQCIKTQIEIDLDKNKGEKK